MSREGVVAARVIGRDPALPIPLIARNTVMAGEPRGAGDGIRTDDPTSGDIVWRNTISRSVNHDCHDTTSGTGTTGSANTWASDTAALQYVANLCFSGAASGVAD